MTHHHKHAVLAHPGQGKPATTPQTASASGDRDPSTHPVSAEVIRLCAYRKWERAGKPAGDGIQFWLEAEQELVQGK